MIVLGPVIVTVSVLCWLRHRPSFPDARGRGEQGVSRDAAGVLLQLRLGAAPADHPGLRQPARPGLDAGLLRAGPCGRPRHDHRALGDGDAPLSCGLFRLLHRDRFSWPPAPIINRCDRCSTNESDASPPGPAGDRSGTPGARRLRRRAAPMAASGWPPDCRCRPAPSARVTGCPCPTCGATRCVLALLHGRVAEAPAWNPLVFAGLARWRCSISTPPPSCWRACPVSGSR